MLLSVLALGVLIGQLPTSASPSQPTTDQSASITVIAQEDGLGVPIEGITITVGSPSSPKLAYRASTFSNGTVELTGLAPGRYFVMASSSELLSGAPSPGIGDAPSGSQSEGRRARDHRVRVQEASCHPRAGADPEWEAGAGSDRRGRHDEIPIPRTPRRRSGSWIADRCRGSLQNRQAGAGAVSRESETPSSHRCPSQLRLRPSWEFEVTLLPPPRDR